MKTQQCLGSDRFTHSAIQYGTGSGSDRTQLRKSLMLSSYGYTDLFPDVESTQR